MKPDIRIEITGPGLVVNGAGLKVVTALKEAGFDVSWEEWAGLDQWPEDRRTEFMVKQALMGISVRVTVNPQPWGA